MAENSKIEWCDHTFNPWVGCSKVSPGCANCYAEANFDLRKHRVKWGPGNPRSRTSAENWKKPLKWDRAKFFCTECNNWHEDDWCEACGRTIDKPSRPKVFCSSLADWLDDEVPIELLANLLSLMNRCRNLDWLMLTKRPENFVARVGEAARFLMAQAEERPMGLMQDIGWIVNWLSGKVPPSNVWIGVSVEDQQRADERIPELLKIPAQIHFLSMEPLLGPVLLKEWMPFAVSHGLTEPSSGRWFGGIHWVIAGGESGVHARPLHPDWVRGLRDQCASAGVPFLFKQWGEWLPGEQTHDSGTGYRQCDTGEIYGSTGHPKRENFGTHPDRRSGNLITLKIGKKSAGRLLDGVKHNDFPIH